jgi:MOSC domain-containing protein
MADELQSSPSRIGTVAALWRYPVKSMMGDELENSLVTERGLLGDRSYALQDIETGRIVNAKNPKKFGKLLDFKAMFVDPPVPGRGPSAVMFSFPDGASVRSDDPNVEAVLSEEVGTSVRLLSSASEQQSYDEYWPDIEGRRHRAVVTTESMPPRSFFDSSPVHIITTATLARLGELHPKGRFDPRRFRPNLVVETSEGTKDFVENSWLGKAFSIGGTRLRITKLCARCVMTTLSQGDLPSDVDILRTVVLGNRANVGAYATVEQQGTIAKGDPVRIQ